MSNSFALELQKGIRAALVADSGVTALVSARIYDEPPQNVKRTPLCALAIYNRAPWILTALRVLK